MSIIILNFNGKDYLSKCIFSVLQTRYPIFEIILVDNASMDNSLNMIESLFGDNQRLRIVRNKSNLGFSGGNNVGFKHSIGKYIVFLNSDTIVDPEWLTHLVQTLEDDESIGLAQGLVFSIDGQVIQTAGFLLSDYYYFKRSLFKDYQNTTSLPPIFEVSYTSGAAMIGRREIVNQSGLFNPEITFYYDDNLLSIKTWLAGKRVVTVSKSKIFHIGEAATGDNLCFKEFHGERSKILILFDVNYYLNDLAKALLVHAFSTFYDLINYASKRNRAVFSGRFHALTWSFRNFKYIWVNRLKHWEKAKISPQILYNKFIRLKLPIGLCFLPDSFAKKYYMQVYQNYENRLISIEKYHVQF